MRHHGRAEDGDGEIETTAIDARHQAVEQRAGRRVRPEDLDSEAGRHDRDQRKDEGLDGANAEALEPEQQQRIGGGEDDADEQRNVEEQVERDGRAQHFSQVAGGDGDFRKHPQRDGERTRIGFAAGLRQVAPVDDAEPRAERLQQNGHGVRHDQHPQQTVPETRAAFEIGGPVTWVHVADADQVSWPGEGEHAAPERDLGDIDARVHVGE